MKRSLVGVLLLLCCVVGGAATLSAQGVTTGAVRGKVTDEAGNPIVGATCRW